MISTHHLEVPRTARYFTLGEMNAHTEEVWILLHGYAQLASELLADLELLGNGRRFLVAPEALSRFYAKGLGGKPAASWMTSEDRDHEIRDYTRYLELLCESLQLSAFEGRIVLLGFSQGVATASRWLQQTQLRIDHFIICSGEVASELQQLPESRLQHTPLTYITALSDPLIKPDKHQAYRALLESYGARVISFESGHRIDPDSVLAAADNLFAQ